MKTTPHNPNALKQERIAYILIVIVLAIYGFRDSEAAERLIRAVKEAFTILFQ